MTMTQWVKKYLGKQIEWDDVSPYQCVDAAKCYLQEVHSIKTKGRGTSPWGNAKDYYVCFEDKSWGGYKKLHDAHFVRIANTSSFVPMRGDIGIFGRGEYGHICVCEGTGNTSYFVSYDQNWGGEYLRKVEHDYNDYKFLGVLRPPRIVKAAVNVRSTPSTALGSKTVIDELKKGTKVTVYEYKGNWAKISKNEQKWISANYLKEL